MLKYYLWTGQGDHGVTSGSYLAKDEETLKAELESEYQIKVMRAIVIDELLTMNEMRVRMGMKPIQN